MSKDPKKKRHRVNDNHFNLKNIKPRTEAQRNVFETFHNAHLLLHGMAGTGKTYISIFLALNELFRPNTPYQRLVIIRSAVATRDIGFMPGTLEEKLRVYEQPYRDIVNDLCERGDAYDILKQKFVVEFMSTSYIRGLTLSNCIIVVDEVQNMKFSELDSVITRLGDNSKVVFCGDFRQTDLNAKEREGLFDFIKILDKMKEIEHVEFQAHDIIRSDLVKKYIITKAEMNIP